MLGEGPHVAFDVDGAVGAIAVELVRGLLALLATNPGAQGRGLGSSLLGPVLDRCDSEGIPAYTETQKHENVSW